MGAKIVKLEGAEIAALVKLEGAEIAALVKDMESIEKERQELNEEFRLRSEALEKVHKERHETIWKQIRALAGFDPDQRGLEIDAEYLNQFGVAFIKMTEECQCPVCKMKRGENLDLGEILSVSTEEIRH